MRKAGGGETPLEFGFLALSELLLPLAGNM